MDAHLAATQINAHRPVKVGTLRFWGVWFGKAYDNWHQITACHATDDALILQFDGGEVLTVTEPDGLIVGSNVFSIRTARSVRWEWFYYGRQQAPENLRFCEFVHRGANIEARTNGDGYQPNLAPSLKANAVEIL